MGGTVLVDAQFGITKILRPYPGFETDYQGKDPRFQPIALTERGLPLDPLAGAPGYAPNLLRGLAVPLGARVVLWLPNVIAGGPPNSFYPYKYAIGWRLRSTFDYRQSRGPYHYPKQGKGVPDTTAPPGKQDRVVKPTGWQTITFTDIEPTPRDDVRSTASLHAEDLVNRAGGYALNPPLIPGGAFGTMQQGILDPAAFSGFAPMPFFNIHEVQALGDEMMLIVYRDILSDGGNVAATWDFANEDAQFSIFYGNGGGAAFPDIGVYVLAGAAT